jgi:hypothetical protein
MTRWCLLAVAGVLVLGAPPASASTVYVDDTSYPCDEQPYGCDVERLVYSLGERFGRTPIDGTVDVSVAPDGRTATIEDSTGLVNTQPDADHLVGCRPTLGGATCTSELRGPVNATAYPDILVGGDTEQVERDAYPIRTGVIQATDVTLFPVTGHVKLAVTGPRPNLTVEGGSADAVITGPDPVIAISGGDLDTRESSGTVTASLGPGSYRGGPSPDIVRAGLAVVDTGAGDDRVEGGNDVRTGDGADSVDEGAGSGPKSIDTGAGDDLVDLPKPWLYGRDPDITLDCGAGDDTVTMADPEDVLSNCEHVTYIP